MCHQIFSGTLLAIAVTFLSYIGYGAMIGGCYLSEASGIESEYLASITGNDSIPHFDNCDISVRNGTRCQYGSSNDYQVKNLSNYMQVIVAKLIPISYPTFEI
jgi:hypothetical protein